MNYFTFFIFLITIILVLGCQKDKTAQDAKLDVQEKISVEDKKTSITPDKQSLLDIFDKEITSNGYNRSFGVDYKKNEGNWMEWKKINEFSWSRGIVGVEGSVIIAKDITINENESDRFPYIGTIAYTIESASKFSSEKPRPRAKQIEYLFGKKTNKWVRKETLTP